MRETTFYTDPQVLFLSQVLEELHKGKMEIPRFQRPLVWDWEKRVELLRSVRDGIPMGAIMVWRTTNNKMNSFETIGPFKLQRPETLGARQYLLDGVQRLTTLYGALYEMSSVASTLEQDDYGVLYDLETDEFLNRKDFDSFSDRIAKILPLHIILDSVALIRFQRGLPEQAEHLVSKVDEIAGAFRNYKVPIIPITTDDLELATRTFQRINSQGEPMNEAHMLQALTWGSDFDLREQLSELRSERLAPLGWADIDDDVILRTCKVAAGMDVYQSNIDELSNVLKGNPAALSSAIQSLSRAVSFLRSECGVPSQSFLPYSLQLTILAEVFRLEPDPSTRLNQALIDWFNVSSYGELFRGMSGYRLQKTISDLKEGLKKNKIGWSGHKRYERLPLKNTFDLRAARAKSLVLLLLRQNDIVYQGEAFVLLGDLGRLAVPQLVSMSRSETSSPANRFLIRPEKVGEFRSALALSDVSDDVLIAHAITDEAHDAWRQNDLPLFIQLRFEELVRLENEFISPIEERYFS